MKELGTYQNGNTITTIFDDGTKIHVTEDNDFEYSYAESCDIKVSQCCNNGCEFCYAGCSSTGKHGDLTSWNFHHTMHPYTEIAINLQFPTPPDLMEFLYTMKAQNVFVNATINQRHFMSEYGQQFIKFLYKMDLIKGIGISLVDPTEEGFIDTVKEYPNAIITDNAGAVSENVCTGYSIVINGGTYILVKKGDVNGDGDIDVSDVVAMLNHIKQTSSITDEAKLEAATVSGEADISVTDVVKELNYIKKSLEDILVK